METLTLAPSISDLITSLASVFSNSDLSGAKRILSSWVEALKSELSKPLTDELFLMEVEKAEFEFKISRLKKELDSVKKVNASLQEKVSTLSEIMEEFKQRFVFESIKKGGLDIRVFFLENELELLEEENVALKEKIMSKVAEETKREKSTGDECGREEDWFANKTPTKRAFRAVCSDSESESDDNLPIGKLFNVKRVNEEKLVAKKARSRKKRLVRVGEIEGHGVSGGLVMENLTVGNVPGPTSEPGGSGFTMNQDTSSKERCELDVFSDIEDYGECEVNKADSSGSPVARKMSSRKRNRKLISSDIEEEKDDSQLQEEAGAESDSEGSSLGGFIVRESVPECDNPNSPFSETESDSEHNVALVEVLNKFKRVKKNSEWECEADMLADFGKSPELCFHAVCALSRQQTEEEQETKSTLVINYRGFSQMDASRGSEIAEFLTDNDLWGPLKKTVEDLQEYDPGAIEICEKLAKRYSKQLFTIFCNGEDPFFKRSMFDL